MGDKKLAEGDQSQGSERGGTQWHYDKLERESSDMYQSIGQKRKVHTFLQSSKRKKKKNTTMRVEKYIQIQKNWWLWKKGKSRQRKRTDEVRLEWSERHASSSKFYSSILSLTQKKKKKIEY